jgi:uncharacterized protein (DUF2235 family)
MKKLIIFCDGTWNDPDETDDGQPCPTNVVKLANALKPVSSAGVVQRMYYDTGVGTHGGFLHRVFDGATGTGISEKIKQAYSFVIENYEQGDELYFFGFSRGAFTVRSLSGLIRNSGILRREYSKMVTNAYELYRSRGPSCHPRSAEAVLFRRTYAIEEETTIKFIGVWDTVGALGNPLLLNGIVSRSNEFHDTDLSSKVENAFQALAIDEKRKNFQPALWKQQVHSVNQTLEQVWFTGVHSDVGGGYAGHELSDIPLLWMLEKATKCGLEFDTGQLNVNCNPLGKMHESYAGFYKIFNPFFRIIGVDTDGKKTFQSINPSVKEKYQKDTTYRPQNLVDYFNINPKL